jgi:23S rRNA (guanosine2251-2'-O)-methyltransferase
VAIILFGNHACKAALLAKKHKFSKIYLQNNKDTPDWLKGDLKKIIRIEIQEFKKLLPKDAVHQGVAIEISDDSKYYSDITDLANSPKNCCIAILDGVTDPHNLGAVIRSAAAFGIKFIIIQDRSSCKINGTVAKAASGALENVSICIVKNIASAINSIKEYGFWVITLDETGDKYINEIDLRGKTCLIFGAEGTGTRRLQKENSDFLAKLPTKERFSTLNISNAATIAFYETAKQNNFCL